MQSINLEVEEAEFLSIFSEYNKDLFFKEPTQSDLEDFESIIIEYEGNLSLTAKYGGTLLEKGLYDFRISGNYIALMEPNPSLLA